MKTEASAQQIEQYQQQGFLVIEEFLEAGELQHWRAVTEDAIRLRLTDTTILNNQANPDTFYDHFSSIQFYSFTQHPDGDVLNERYRQDLTFLRIVQTQPTT